MKLIQDSKEKFGVGNLDGVINANREAKERIARIKEKLNLMSEPGYEGAGDPQERMRAFLDSIKDKRDRIVENVRKMGDEL